MDSKIWDFCTAQTSRAYMDLYEITGNKAYKQASIDARHDLRDVYIHQSGND